MNEKSRLALRGADNQVGEVPAEDIQNDTMYLCPVVVGEGETAVTLNLDFDTGSADLWGISIEETGISDFSAFL